MQRCSKLGFTLLELLAVIAVIGLLAATLLSTLGRAKGKGQGAVCVNNVKQLGIGLQTFLSDHHSYPVNQLNKKPPVGSESEEFWTGQLLRDAFGIAKPSTNFNQTGIWQCPSARWSSDVVKDAAFPLSSYGYNDDKYNSSFTKLSQADQMFGLQGHYNSESKFFTPISESEVSSPSDMMAIADSFQADWVLMRRSLEAFQEYGNVQNRHNGKGNVVFCDGHVESPKRKFLFEDTTDSALARWNRDHQPHSNKY